MRPDPGFAPGRRPASATLTSPGTGQYPDNGHHGHYALPRARNPGRTAGQASGKAATSGLAREIPRARINPKRRPGNRSAD